MRFVGPIALCLLSNGCATCNASQAEVERRATAYHTGYGVPAVQTGMLATGAVFFPPIVLSIPLPLVDSALQNLAAEDNARFDLHYEELQTKYGPCPNPEFILTESGWRKPGLF